ncbi:MAG: hypothetical protein GY839_11765 [candidate division Zixibacteria bacterium]|nr:hypothetical protein [candidate division Zixibacteria bacterium]
MPRKIPVIGNAAGIFQLGFSPVIHGLQPEAHSRLKHYNPTTLKLDILS